MGDIRLKQQTDSSKKNKLDSKQLNPSKKFVLSDVSKEELKKEEYLCIHIYYNASKCVSILLHPKI